MLLQCGRHELQRDLMRLNPTWVPLLRRKEVEARLWRVDHQASESSGEEMRLDRPDGDTVLEVGLLQEWKGEWR